MGVAILGRLDHTGHIGRVQTVERLAKQFGLALPAPIERQGRKEGEPPFIFDRRCWFVDGVEGRATGHSLAPEVRPELWRCYATLRRINQLDPSVLPSAVIIADETRFMRAEGWLQLWYQAIRGEGVDLILPELGRVQPIHLQILGMKIRSASDHLPEYRRRALAVAQAQGRIVWGRYPFGLTLEDEGRSVVAHPEQWPVIAAVVHRLADGSLPSVMAAAVWARQTFGLPTCSEFLIRKWIAENSFTYGAYTAYNQEWTLCQIKEKKGILADISFTDSRNRRYVKERRPEDQSLVKPILHWHGTSPIPPEVIDQARQNHSISGSKPKRPKVGEHAWQILPGRLIRCEGAVPGGTCGKLVRERAPDPPGSKGAPGMRTDWTLGCTAGQQMRQRRGFTLAEVRAHPDTQHVRARNGCLSRAVVALLKERLFGFDPAPHSRAEPGAVQERRQEIELEQAGLRTKLKRQCLLLEDVDPEREPDTFNQIRSRMRELQEAINNGEREQQILAAQYLAGSSAQAELQETRARFRQMLSEHEEDPSFWRAVIETFVTKIPVNLETGAFTVEVNLKDEALSELAGVLPEACHTSASSRR
jgi:hypothetical protein